METYEGKSERDILIELYLKMQQMEKDIKLLNTNFDEYKKQKSQRIQAMQEDFNAKIDVLTKDLSELDTWRSETIGLWKGITIFATILGVVGTILGGIAVFIL